MIDSHPRYSDDYQFVHLLLSGHTDAWDRFYKEFRKKIAIYINRKYPSIFNSSLTLFATFALSPVNNTDLIPFA